MTYRLELEAFVPLDNLHEAIACGREAFLSISPHNTTPMYEDIYMQAARDYCLGQRLVEDAKDLDLDILIGILAFPILDRLDPEHWPECVRKVMAPGVAHLAKLDFQMPLMEQLLDLNIPGHWADILIYVGYAEIDGSNAATSELHICLRHAARLSFQPNASYESTKNGGFGPKSGPNGLRIS